jgi:hypothetical protein
MRADGARALWRGCESFVKYAKKEGKATEQVLADWLEGVRRNGLPREYVREFQASGFDDAHMAKRRAFLEGVDPKEAAEALGSFSRLVAPLLVADARGEAKAPAPPPEEDDLWDLAVILLLRSAPAEGGGR